MRFLIQWVRSEQAKASINIAIFWKLSIAGNFFLYLHSVIQNQYPMALLTSLHVVLAWRNLNLFKPKCDHVRFTTVLALLGLMAVASTSLFAGEQLLLGETVVTWVRSPKSLPNIAEKIVPTWVHVVGFLGVGLFSLRFWVQWWQAERSEKSALLEPFWWISLVGAILASCYFATIFDWVNLIGPVSAIVPYTRNIWLIRHAKVRSETT